MPELYSNPVSVYITGNETKEFNYKPDGDIHFCVRISDKNWIPVNTMVFAKDKKSAKKVVRDACLFAIARQKDYDKNMKDSVHYTGSHELSNAEEILTLIDKGKIKVERIEVNQLFKIGWGSNDTIF